MGRNPLVGVIFGALAIGFSICSMTTRTETPPPGYALLDYGIILIGAIAIVGSLAAYFKRK